MSKLYIFLLPPSEPIEAHRWHSLFEMLQKRGHFYYAELIKNDVQIDLDKTIDNVIQEFGYLVKEVVVIMSFKSLKEGDNLNSFKKKIILLSETKNHFKQLLEDSKPYKKMIPEKDKSHYCCLQFFQRKWEELDNYIFNTAPPKIREENEMTNEVALEEILGGKKLVF